jgi:hypothetical protein
MALLVDDCLWWWRGHRWCHLVSDRDLHELVHFADALGIPRRGFQGDHYDLPEHARPAAVAAGALEVGSRELLVRLRAAGLRLGPSERRAMRTGALDLSQRWGHPVPPTGIPGGLA